MIMLFTQNAAYPIMERAVCCPVNVTRRPPVAVTPSQGSACVGQVTCRPAVGRVSVGVSPQARVTSLIKVEGQTENEVANGIHHLPFYSKSDKKYVSKTAEAIQSPPTHPRLIHTCSDNNNYTSSCLFNSLYDELFS